MASQEVKRLGVVLFFRAHRDSHGGRTQCRVSTPDGIERVRQAAKQDRKQRFTALLHHVYDVDRLRGAYFAVKRDAAAGIDGETWRHYGEALEANLRDLAARVMRGAYRASPVRRAYIPKADGRQRPLGVPTLEDKIVQRAVVEVLSAIYEQECEYLANIYLHYVFDLWVHRWRRTHARGDVVVVRFADDCAPRRRGEETVM
jgi:hypothetical protein